MKLLRLLSALLRQFFCAHLWRELRPLKVGHQPGVVVKCTLCGAVRSEYVFGGTV